MAKQISKKPVQPFKEKKPAASSTFKTKSKVSKVFKTSQNQAISTAVSISPRKSTRTKSSTATTNSDNGPKPFGVPSSELQAYGISFFSLINC